MNNVGDDNIYILNSIQRYNTQHRLHSETVASHSFFVVYYVSKICDELGLDTNIRLMSLEAAVLHDIPEVKTNDITHDAKQMLVGLSDLLQPYEEAIIKSHNDVAYRVLFHPETIEEQISQYVVKHADIISVYMYCMNEVDLGNSTFRGKVTDTLCRIKESLINLEALISTYKVKNKNKEGKQHA